ncbi:MAG: hypothetical protein GF329_08355 [Candidatus Lokiarchaeota archaeon]|nr:hypothetical protein [Candidatus Lokiarchaeota archaeon]
MTTIQISKKNQERLIRIISDYQKKIGRRVSYDEIIEIIINHFEASNRAMNQFKNDFGILSGNEEEVWTDLRNLKSQKDEKLEQYTK